MLGHIDDVCLKVTNQCSHSLNGTVVQLEIKGGKFSYKVCPT